MTADDSYKPKRRPVTLTKKQMQEEAGLGLLQICQSVAEDGILTDEEILSLSEWLDQHPTSDYSSIIFLRDLISRVLADGKIMDQERKDIFSGIERVLPADIREVVKNSRRRVEESEREKNRIIAHFDFMVAGARRKEYSELIDRFVEEGDEIILDREFDNSHDKNAICVHCGQDCHIGYVPRSEAKEMAELIDAGAKYKAFVKKILGYEKPIPVVVAEFYQSESTIEGLCDKTTKATTSGCGGCGCVAIVLVVLFLSVLLLFGFFA